MRKATPIPDPVVAEVLPEPAAVAEPAPVVGILTAIKDFKPSEPTRLFGAHLGRNAQTLLQSAEMSLNEGLYALRQLHNDAMGAVTKAHQTNDADGLAAATADVQYLDNVIAFLKG
jgi:hypothetical protein